MQLLKGIIAAAVWRSASCSAIWPALLHNPALEVSDDCVCAACVVHPPCLACRRVNYKLINRPSRLGDPLMRGPVTKSENKGLFLSRWGCL